MALVGPVVGWHHPANVESRLVALEAANPYPHVSMELVAPLPGAMSPATIPAGGAVDLDIWSIKLEREAGAVLLDGNRYVQVTQMFSDLSVAAITVYAHLTLLCKDVTASAGNVEWTCNANSGVGLGTGGEIVLETTVFLDQVTGNGRALRFGSSELFELPTSATPLEFGLRLSHNSGSPRDLLPVGLEVVFLIEEKA